ncbi:hypothetical protein [Georgenia sunbinii]|uniref:hypothetical protein n=1 Tax=Georgenia sunbinii TaxID=3117728 RepID=UPI002F2640DB
MRPRLVAALAVLLALAACGTEPEPAVPVATEPVPVGQMAPAADVPAAAVPLALSDLPVLDPGWEEAPQELDGLLLAIAHPEQSGGPIRFIAAREDGTVLWQAERPPSCTGFTLTSDGERTIAVLTDVTAGTETLSETTASGYDLATGERLWGPEPVPGPHQGPGAVFAAPAPGAAMGETGPRVVLDPATGQVLATEDDGVAVVGELAGALLTTAGGELTASGVHEWSVDLASLGLEDEPVVLPGVLPPVGTVLLAERGSSTGVLVDLRTGDRLAADVAAAARDPLSGTLVTAAAGTVTGLPEGDEPWQREVPGARLLAAANVLAYLQVGDGVQVVNAVTGQDAVAYDDDVAQPAVPLLVTAGGGTVLDAGGPVLVPARP